MDISQKLEILKNDLIWARHYYNEYKKLYMANQLRIELLNDTASSFFAVLQRVLWEQMIISLSRLTDAHERGENKNLTVGILLELAIDNNWEFVQDIESKLLKIKETSAAIRKWRNKVVAHRDLPTALSEGALLDKVDLHQVDDLLRLIGNVVNLAYIKLTNAEQSWDLISDGDVDALIHHLKLAKIYDSLKESEDDWKKEDKEWQSSKYKDA